jgi:hypothetical protein
MVVGSLFDFCGDGFGFGPGHSIAAKCSKGQGVGHVVDDITEYCAKVLRLFRKIYSEKDLEHENAKRYSVKQTDC